MNRTQSLRRALALSVPFNLGGAAAFAFPSSWVGALLGLPPDVPVLYRATVALFVSLFAGAYAWLARQPSPDRPLVAFAAIGKAAFFGLTLALWAGGQVSGLVVAAAAGDLVLAGVFAWGLGATS